MSPDKEGKLVKSMLSLWGKEGKEFEKLVSETEIGSHDVTRDSFRVMMRITDAIRTGEKVLDLGQLSEITTVGKIKEAAKKTLTP